MPLRAPGRALHCESVGRRETAQWAIFQKDCFRAPAFIWHFSAIWELPYGLYHMLTGNFWDVSGYMQPGIERVHVTHTQEEEPRVKISASALVG
jgi:hypothetical protein